MLPMELLCDVGHVKSCFGPFGDGVSVMQDRPTFCAERRNHFALTRWFS
jgi:hypothetical protein